MEDKDSFSGIDAQNVMRRETTLYMFLGIGICFTALPLKVSNEKKPDSLSFKKMPENILLLYFNPFYILNSNSIGDTVILH